MSSQIGIARHYHQVAAPGAYVLLAAWAQVGLASLVGLEEPNLDGGIRSFGMVLPHRFRLSASHNVTGLPYGHSISGLE